MDLSFVQEQLDTFATFAGAIGDFLQKPAEILGSVFDWFNGEDPNPLLPEAETNADISVDWETTQGAFGSSNGDDAAAQGENKGSSDFSLSSNSEDAN
ncbi:PorH family porin [Corynebacterium casei]|uniref:PorH family porin n=1 Tax=Corynebacterium casei TaxID=160386 RepID=UPI003F981148